MNQIDLYTEFLKEKKICRNLGHLQKILGYGSIALFFYLLWGRGFTEPKFVILSYYGLYANLSWFMLYKYFEIPEIFSYLNSEDENLVEESYRTIDNHRLEILEPVIIVLYGRRDLNKYLQADKETILSIMKDFPQTNWKKIGKVYFYKFLAVTIFSYWFAFF